MDGNLIYIVQEYGYDHNDNIFVTDNFDKAKDFLDKFKKYKHYSYSILEYKVDSTEGEVVY